ncbi:ras and Rab interactor 3 [Pelodytes ibericus]
MGAKSGAIFRSIALGATVRERVVQSFGALRWVPRLSNTLDPGLTNPKKARGPSSKVVELEKQLLTPEPKIRPVLPSISLLDRLIKTCPVWLQLCMSQEQAVEILKGEAEGVFLVTLDVEQKCMVLLTHFTGCGKQSDILRYNIMEEKSMMLLQGSVLVFEEIFKLIAFYCVSRDILPLPLKLPKVIARAQTSKDLETISNLGTGFWESSLKEKRGLMLSHTGKFPLLGNVDLGHHLSQAPSDCTCSIELSVGSDRLWFVNPIFIEECCNTETPDKLPLANCVTNAEAKTPKIVYRRPPPPPPPPALSNPPLPSIPPSAPPNNYIAQPVSPSFIPSSNALLTCSPPVTDLLTPCSSSGTSITPHTPPASYPSQDTCVRLSSAPASPPHSPPSSSQSRERVDPSGSTIVRVEDHLVGQSSNSMKINSVEGGVNDPGKQEFQIRSHSVIPPVVPRRRPSGKISEKLAVHPSERKDKDQNDVHSSPKLKVDTPRVKLESKDSAEIHGRASFKKELDTLNQQSPKSKKAPPVPPPRIKKLSQRFVTVDTAQGNRNSKGDLQPRPCSKVIEPVETCSSTQVDAVEKTEKKGNCSHLLTSQQSKGSDTSLNSPTDGSQLHNTDQDSFSTSSTEDDSERLSSPSIKKSQSFMLGRAKNRLSIVAITNVFTAFMSSDRKLQKKITELAQDKESYFGNLVQDYKAYSLDMMAKQSSSTEMLQEIRLMMTQLKSYLVQSMELKSMVDYSLYTDDKIDLIVEAALCKCVLKPLKAPIESYLRDIHNKDGSLRLLRENQLVIQNMTTTDLGVTTSVPENGVMEKIVHKFGTMHKTYSPEKKITYLLKSCKLMYDSMATGSPGKPHGADDFLPVLMYVLARCELEALLLDVEYMMELMDPSLQLGEGSYYLTTTYGALEHIKNYDKITVTRQLSMEVQDSIHRWERRRTLNKARVSRSSIQDFITISLETLESKTTTLVIKSDTSVELILQQCSEKFETLEPQSYGLFVIVNDRCLRLAEDSFPHQVKSHLLKHEQKLDFHFLYKPTSTEDTVVKDLDFL